MEQILTTLLFLLGRYVHIIAAALLIGGTLFYELIVPVAIDELKDPQKLSVFARARWAFRWIVWFSVIALLISGVSSTIRNWNAYNGVEAAAIDPLIDMPSDRWHIRGAGHWWIGHTVLALIGVGVALALVRGRTPPRYPLVWMRINLVILLLVIFFASVTRDMRLRVLELHINTATQVAVD